VLTRAKIAPWFALACSGVGFAATTELPLEGRFAYVYVPDRLPAGGARRLVLVLHGGLGNPERIAHLGSRHGLNLDALADALG